jgi:hypothetical protein
MVECTSIVCGNAQIYCDIRQSGVFRGRFLRNWPPLLDTRIQFAPYRTYVCLPSAALLSRRTDRT